MGEVAAVSALGLTVTLALSRPRIGRRVIGPALAALAGVLLMLITGHVGFADIGESLLLLWRPLVAIASIMVMASAAGFLGVIDRLAATIVPWAHGSAGRLYGLVFALSAVTAAVLNNDSAVLVLTPLVVLMVRRCFPGRPALLVPFAFAVFMAAGVAPLVTANPMNLIVADFAGLDFNAYAARMVPVALAGMAVTYAVLRGIFRAELREPAGAVKQEGSIVKRPPAWGAPERQGLLLVVVVLTAYPVVAYFDGVLWLVAAGGAVAALVLCAAHGAARPVRVLADGVSWQILVFLAGLFTMAIGLRNAGVVQWLTGLYGDGDVSTIGVVSAIGSALINNHSMALTNILAIEATGGADHVHFLAALVGGDLGPRLLPIGSLAGLLWLAALDRLAVRLPVHEFVRVGVLVTVPSLAVSLAVLTLVA